MSRAATDRSSSPNGRFSGAAQRFALQDKNGDGVLSVAEKEANLAKLAGVMQQAGKPVPERMSQLKPSRETTRAQFMAR